MQKQQPNTKIQVSEYADHPEWWCDNVFTINADGHVEGVAYIFDSENSIDVTAAVNSYNYERGGETRTNHIPHIVVSDPDGSIQKEPHAHDSKHPRTALKRAIQTAESAYKRNR